MIGRVSMDQIVVEIPRGARADVGDAVFVLGGDPASAAPSIGEMADLMDTNAYEVIVGIRERMPRLFFRGGELVAARVSVDAATSIQCNTGGTRELTLRRKLGGDSFQIIDVATHHKRATTHVIANVIKRPVIHPAVDGRSRHPKLLRRTADADELGRIVGAVFREREHPAQIRIPEGAGNSVVLGGGRPKQHLEDSINCGEDQIFRFADFAAGERRKPLQVAAQGSSLEITQGQFPEGFGMQLT